MSNHKLGYSVNPRGPNYWGYHYFKSLFRNDRLTAVFVPEIDDLDHPRGATINAATNGHGIGIPGNTDKNPTRALMLVAYDRELTDNDVNLATLAHEMGHALWLDHNTLKPTMVMNPGQRHRSLFGHSEEEGGINRWSKKPVSECHQMRDVIEEYRLDPSNKKGG